MEDNVETSQVYSVSRAWQTPDLRSGQVHEFCSCRILTGTFFLQAITSLFCGTQKWENLPQEKAIQRENVRPLHSLVLWSSLRCYYLPNTIYFPFFFFLVPPFHLLPSCNPKWIYQQVSSSESPVSLVNLLCRSKRKCSMSGDVPSAQEVPCFSFL